MITIPRFAIDGVIGAADNGDGTYRLDFSASDSRLATADEIRAAKIATVTDEIKADRDRRKSLGCTVGPHRFHSDDASRIQQLGLVMMGANLPAGVQWKTMSGTFVTMTPTLAAQIFQATAARDMAVFAVAEQHKAGVWAAADPSAYNWQTGWPASYQG